MAGPYVSNFYFRNGKRLSVYQAANAAVGTYLPCEISGVAASTSSVEFSVPAGEVWEVVDFVSPNTAGEFEIIKDGASTDKFVPTDATRAATAGNNRFPISLVFVPGPRYKLRESVAGAA